MPSHNLLFRLRQILRILLLLLYIQVFVKNGAALQIRASPYYTARSDKCNEVMEYQNVLMKNLECPSIGSYAVAGICGYFARCLQTEKGVEAEVDFCPDGQVYIVNRCTNPERHDDCPQKTCPLEHFTGNGIVLPEQNSLKKPMVPETSHVKSHPMLTKIPLNLHPSFTNNAKKTNDIVPTIIFLLTALLTVNYIV